MRTKLLATLLATMIGTLAMAQSKFTVSGTIIETDTKEVVPMASVSLLSVPDSALVTGNTSDLSGVFKINNVQKGNYLLKVTFVGYLPKVISLDLNDKKDRTVDVGYITLDTDSKLLDEAVVSANAAKVQVSGDSLVFNASAYRMTEGSMLEDLVKKLPGATVDQDGTIKINGKEVKKVLVDGKEFFINDKSIAMKNLPTKIIDKIKSYDRKSDLARVTGIDDGEEETVLDLTVKKGMNNGWFGQLSGAIGTEDRYNVNANVNRFNNQNQYSLIARSENIPDYGGGGGGGRWGRWGGSNGLYQSKELGFNFATATEKLETGGYVWHNYNGTNNRSESFTQNFVTSTGAFNESLNQSYGSNASLSAGFRLEWKPDSMTNIIFRPNANYSRNRGSSYGDNATFNNDPNDYDSELVDLAETKFGGATVYSDAEIDEIVEMIVNTNRSRQQTYSNSRGANGELQLNRRLSDNGRNITLRLTGGFSNSDSKQLSASSIIYSQASGRTPDTNNRYYTTPTRSNNYSVRATYSEPIFERTYLQLSYTFNYSYNKSDRDAYTYDPVAYNDLVTALRNNRYDIAGAINDLSALNYERTLSETLSQLSEYRNMNHTISLMLRVVRDKYNLSVGVDALPQHSELNYKYMGKEYPEITRNVFNFAPSANLRYNFNNTTNLHLNYRGRTSQPSMTNLLDITDDSNPLNITKGNPGLKPSFNQNVNLFFNTYNVETQTGIFSRLYASLTQNSISTRTSYDTATGVRTTRPENINGNWNAGAGFGFNTALDKAKYFTLNSNTDFGYQNSVSYLDPQQYEQDKSTTKSLNLGQSLSLSYRNDWLEVSLNGNISYRHSDNNVLANSKLNTYTFSYGTDVVLTAPWGTSLSTDISMSSRRGYTQQQMNTNELLWNAQLSHSFLRGNALTVALSWNDILKEQSNISRTVSAMMSSDSRYNAIYSYGMLKVIYKLNIFAGKNSNGTENARDQWGNTGGNRGPGGRGGGRPPRF
jgi:hypothetical protein